MSVAGIMNSGLTGSARIARNCRNHARLFEQVDKTSTQAVNFIPQAVREAITKMKHDRVFGTPINTKFVAHA